MSRFRLRPLLVLLAVILGAGTASAQATWEEAPAEGPTPLQGETDWDAAPDAAQSLAPASPPAGSYHEYTDTDPRALTDFNAELAPHGRWRNDPTYGRVWVPHRSVVGEDFAPYVTNGHWALADDGEWMWVSNYSFGWVVFHYGRWVWVKNVGWAWIPGREYSHAWVVWRVPQDGIYYVGWAPMPPSYIWVDGYAVGIGFGLYTTWVFCPSSYMYSYHVHHHIVRDRHHVHYLASHTHRYTPPRGKAPYTGPSPARARIPAKAVPVRRTPANPKAVAAARPAGGTAAKRYTPPGRPAQRGYVAPARPSRSLGTSPAPSRGAAPAPTARPPAPSRAAPTPYPSAPGYSQPRYVAPTQSAPAPRAAPSRAAPAPSRAAPAPSRAAPAPSRAAPPPSRAAPPPRSSPPSRSAPPPSRGGGGRRR